MAALLEAVALHQQISEPSFGASESVELAEFAHSHGDRHLGVQNEQQGKGLSYIRF